MGKCKAGAGLEFGGELGGEFGWGEARGGEVLVEEGDEPDAGLEVFTTCIEVNGVGPVGGLVRALGCRPTCITNNITGGVWDIGWSELRENFSPRVGNKRFLDALTEVCDGIARGDEPKACVLSERVVGGTDSFVHASLVEAPVASWENTGIIGTIGPGLLNANFGLWIPFLNERNEVIPSGLVCFVMPTLVACLLDGNDIPSTRLNERACITTLFGFVDS